MADELVLIGAPTGMTLYAVIYAPGTNTRLISASAATFAAPSTIASANWNVGLIALTEQKDASNLGTGDYFGNFPTYLTTPGDYPVKFQNGTATTSPNIGSQVVAWSGTAMYTGSFPAPVPLAASQPNYAPALASVLATDVSALTTAIGTPAQASALASLVTTVGVAGAGLTALASAANLAIVETHAANADTASAATYAIVSDPTNGNAEIIDTLDGVFNIVNSGMYGNAVIQASVAGITGTSANPFNFASITLDGSIFTVQFFQNGTLVTSGITLPKITITDQTGATQVSAAALSAAGSEAGTYTYTLGVTIPEAQTIKAYATCDISTVPTTFLPVQFST